MQHHVKPAPNAGARREQLITTADHRWQRCKLHHGAAWFFSYLRLAATDLFSDSAAARHRNGGMMPFPLHAHV